ncbi:MAG: hypothetical protein SNJ78_01630 [Spirochaetales bacterium]
MVLFLVLGIPLFVWFLLERFFSPIDYKEKSKLFFWGALYILPFLFLQGFLYRSFQAAYEGWMLYIRGVAIEILFPFIYIVAGFLLHHRRSFPRSYLLQVENFLCFGSGSMVLLAIQLHLRFQGWEEGLIYLLLPLIWIQLLGVSALAWAVWHHSYRWERFGVVGGSLFWMLLLGWFMYMYRINYRSLAWLFVLGSFIAFTLLFPHVKEKLRYL